METDYSLFLHCLEDGNIWWRLEDAVKLGVGFLPVCDEGNPIPVLRANSDQVRANEKSLLATFNQEEYAKASARLVMRNDDCYVEAHEFLNFLTQCLAEIRPLIPFPNALFDAVASAVPSPPTSAPAKFESLVVALDGCFDKIKEELSEEQRRRVETDFFPVSWNDSSPEQRRSIALQWDSQHDPAIEPLRKFWWELFAKMLALEEQIKEWKAIVTQTAGDRVLKETRISQLQQELDGLKKIQEQAHDRDRRQDKITDCAEGGADAPPVPAGESSAVAVALVDSATPPTPLGESAATPVPEGEPSAAPVSPVDSATHSAPLGESAATSVPVGESAATSVPVGESAAAAVALVDSATPPVPLGESAATPVPAGESAAAAVALVDSATPPVPLSESAATSVPVGESAAAPGLPVRYIPYPKALKLLVTRLGATPEELAAWVFRTHLCGGLDAFLNPNQLDPVPQFSYSTCNGSDNASDYVSPLMACWFREDEVASFEPGDRYIMGNALIERWGPLPGMRPIPFIRAKIAESRLQALYPISGLTQGASPKSDAARPLEGALFALSHVDAIEAEDFAVDDDPLPPEGGQCKPVSAWQIRRFFVVVNDADANEIWWREKMRAAQQNGLAACRVGEGKKGRGGSLWRPDLVAGWLVDRYVKNREGLNSSAARFALKKFPGCEEISETLFPSDE